MTDVPDIPEWTKADFKSSIRGSTRRRIMEGRIESGKDIVALRRFTKLSQKEFARALEISVHTLRNWEQGRRQPEGPADRKAREEDRAEPAAPSRAGLDQPLRAEAPRIPYGVAIGAAALMPVKPGRPSPSAFPTQTPTA